ncbi:MAG: hypothetical protein BAA02_02130 [Paenibacillaceae bacterium ZCTH02-B3]|nr:MAG: hypothetical protein BAA02_02130 [Paenibacillaceae bacterium ZCTH02-B3]
MLDGRYRLGICQWSVDAEGADICRFAAELGLEGVQLEIGTYEDGFPLSRPSVQREFLDSASEYGVRFTSIAARVTDQYDMTQPAGTEDSRIVWEAIVRSIEAAEAMKIPSVMIGSFLASDIKTEEDLVRTAEVLTDACDYAAKRGIVIAAENVLSPDDMHRMAKMIGRPNLKLLFDTQNYKLFRGYDPAEALERLAPLLCDQVHVKDGSGGQISAALLGEGDSGFFRTMETLKKIGYSGWLLLENYYFKEPLRSRQPDLVKLILEDKRILTEALS